MLEISQTASYVRLSKLLLYIVNQMLPSSEKFPGVKKFILSTVEQCRSQGTYI